MQLLPSRLQRPAGIHWWARCPNAAIAIPAYRRPLFHFVVHCAVATHFCGVLWIPSSTVCCGFLALQCVVPSHSADSLPLLHYYYYSSLPPLLISCLSSTLLCSHLVQSHFQLMHPRCSGVLVRPPLQFCILPLAPYLLYTPYQSAMFCIGFCRSAGGI